MADPLVSILIPVYNRKDLTAACIQSALKQTIENLEIIIVDNSSTDGAWEVCENFAKQDKRIRIFRNEANIGPVRNWYRCFAEASAKYGKILFSDDLIYADYLEKTVPFLDNPEVGFVFTAADMGPDIGHIDKIAYRWVGNPNLVSSRKFIMDTLFGGDVPVSPGAALFRLEDLRQNLRLDIPSPSFRDFSNHGAGPDLLLYLLTAAQYRKVAHVAEPLVLFRCHESSISVRAEDHFLDDRYQQAKIWFASCHLDRKILERLMVKTWILERRKYQTRVSLPVVAARYLDTPPKVPIPAILWVVADALRQKVMNRMIGMGVFG